MHVFPAGPGTFRVLVEASPDPVLALAADGEVVFANPAAERLLGRPPGTLPGTPASHLFIGPLPPGTGETAVRTLSGAGVPVEVRAVPLPDTDGPLRALFLRDLTHEHASGRRQRTERAVTRTLADAASLEDAVPGVLRLLCEGLEWDAALLWQAEADAAVLCYADAWHLPSVREEPFLELSRQVAFLPGVGLPGRVWEARAPVWVPRITPAADFPRATRAPGGALRSAFAFPILLEGEVFGVLELLSRGAPEPDPETREMLEGVGSQIAQFVARRRSEAALAAREERFRSLIEYANDVITLLDARGMVRYESPAVEKVLGYTPEELLGTDAFALLHPDDAPRVRDAFALALRTPGVAITLEYRARHRDGSWRVLESVGRNLLHAPAVGGVVVNSRDVSARRKAEEEVKRQSLTDELTGLYNRRGFFVLAEQQLRAARREGLEVMLLYADVDGLKEINDRLGHAAGDRALSTAGRLLAQCFRPGDVVARFGGDEFVVLAPDVSRARGAVLAERLRERLAGWSAAHPEHPPLALSIGMAWYDPALLRTVDALLAEADSAMYARKRRRPA